MRRRFLRWFYDTLADILFWLGGAGDWLNQQGINMSYQASEYDPPSDYIAE